MSFRHCARWMIAPVWIGALGLVLSGCGSETGEKLVPVTGKVTVGGTALPRGNVSFRPDKAGGNTNPAEPYGEIGPDGTYTLFTNKKKGAPPGKYLVMVEASEPIDPKNASATPKSLIDRVKYSNPEKPFFKVEVVEDPSAGKYDLKLEK